MNDPLPRHLFVYGTLRKAYNQLPLPIRQMRPPHILDEKGKWAGTGVLNGYALWDVGKYPGIVECEGKSVLGDLFEIEPDVFQTLDEYEGIGGEYEEPFEYKRKIVQVGNMAVWVYIYNWPTNGELVEDGDYVSYCAAKL